MSRRWLGLTPWVMLSVVVATRFAGAGARSSLGVFFHPLNQEFGWDRTSVSLAISTFTILWGVSVPVAGRLADRFGPRLPMALGVSLMGVGLLGSSTVSHLWQLALWWGMAGSGLALSGATVTSTLLARWFVQNRGMALGIQIGGSSVGGVVLVLVAAALTLSLGWQAALRTTGVLLLVLLPVILLVVRNWPPAGPSPGRARRSGATGGTESPAMGPRVSIAAALGTRAYRCQAIAYFSCGFGALLLAVHLIPLAIDLGLSEMAAARALSLFSASSVVGVVGFGVVSDRWGRKNPLTLVFVLRILGLLILLGARNEGMLLVAAAILGLGYTASGSLVPALIADTFGLAPMGTLLGAISFLHQIAGATGVYMAGYLFDQTGSYVTILVITTGITLAAAVASYLIPEKRLRVAAPAAPAGVGGRVG